MEFSSSSTTEEHHSQTRRNTEDEGFQAQLAVKIETRESESVSVEAYKRERVSQSVAVKAELAEHEVSSLIRNCQYEYLALTFTLRVFCLDITRGVRVVAFGVNASTELVLS